MSIRWCFIMLLMARSWRTSLMMLWCYTLMLRAARLTRENALVNRFPLFWWLLSLLSPAYRYIPGVSRLWYTRRRELSGIVANTRRPAWLMIEWAITGYYTPLRYACRFYAGYHHVAVGAGEGHRRARARPYRHDLPATISVTNDSVTTYAYRYAHAACHRYVANKNFTLRLVSAAIRIDAALNATMSIPLLRFRLAVARRSLIANALYAAAISSPMRHNRHPRDANCHECRHIPYHWSSLATPRSALASHCHISLGMLLVWCRPRH